MDGDVYDLVVNAEVASELPERKDLFTIYKYEGQYYWEDFAGAYGPFPSVRLALQDIAMDFDLKAGVIK